MPTTAFTSLFRNIWKQPSQFAGTDGWNINSFKSKIAKEGVLKNNLYIVSFALPPGLKSVGAYSKIETDLAYCVQSAELPGVTLAAADNVRRYGYGPVEKFAFLPVFQDINFNVIMDGQGVNRKFFDSWMHLITNFNSGSDTGVTSTQKVPLTQFNAYEVSYKQDYITDITITVYNETNDTILIYYLKEAFPIAIGGSQLNWASQNELMSLAVTFTFRDWSSDLFTLTQLRNNSAPSSLPQVFNFTRFLAGSLVGYRNPSSVTDIINVVNGASILAKGLKF